ncbi:MAG: hypothetical protein HFI08_01945 [Bacilli bacterium]|nr:hypothetical protein [Bacilli bacterium]
MNNSEYISCAICKLYDLYKQDSHIKVRCFIETNYCKYQGELIFDEQSVVPKNSISLANVAISFSQEDSIIFYNETVIATEAINAFSYKID